MSLIITIAMTFITLIYGHMSLVILLDEALPFYIVAGQPHTCIIQTGYDQSNVDLPPKIRAN